MNIFEQVKNLVKPQYDKLNCWAHKWQHIEDVVEYSKKLAELENANIQLCIIAAYCHDLGRVEEEARKKRGEIPLSHALFSIEPTVKVLQEVGISGQDFNEIVEAVAVHSYKVYNGGNMIAKILQDADKMAGIKAEGTLDMVDNGVKTEIKPKEIIDFWNDKHKIKECSNQLLNQLDKEANIKELMAIATRIGEYKEMFHLKYSFELIREEYEFFLEFRDKLIRKFNIQ